MKTINVTILLLFINFAFSQNLNIKFIEQISNVSFAEIEGIMIDGYGFQIMEVAENKRKIKFYKVPDDDFDNAIVITVLHSNFPINILDISIGKNFQLEKIKNDLMQNNYLYNGENNYYSWVYDKNNTAVLISQKTNSAGARKILVTYRE